MKALKNIVWLVILWRIVRIIFPIAVGWWLMGMWDTAPTVVSLIFIFRKHLWKLALLGGAYALFMM